MTDPQTIFARQARLPDGWAAGVRLELANGRIADVQTDRRATPRDMRVDTLLPALGNLHSHSFQRAFAGMSEHRGQGPDSFWTWRDVMYRFLDQLTPGHVQAIAALAFMEMQEAGFAAVGEFHYVHHGPGGQTYDRLDELSLRILAAARDTGIGLTHLPVLYSHGGAGKAALAGGQLRFGNDPERFERLFAEISASLSHMPPDTRLGVAPHSLRATTPEDLKRLVALHPGVPLHLHVAEQVREVGEIKAWLGARPVEWLLDNLPVGDNWCLIHATHMSRDETRGLAGSGAVVGLCPVTEANLGDGIFAAAAFLGAGGRFGLGSDSNVRISMVEELRMLEYSQRLRDRARNVLADGTGSLGERLYLGAAAGGARALGRQSGTIAPGQWADLVAIDSQGAALCALSREQILDGLVFCAGKAVVRELWSAGRHMVRDGRHVARDRVLAGYRKAMTDLVEKL